MISGSKYLRSKRDPISIIPTTFEAYIYSGNKEHNHSGKLVLLVFQLTLKRDEKKMENTNNERLHLSFFTYKNIV